MHFYLHLISLGFDTTSLALSFCTHILSTHPEIQAELQDEVRDSWKIVVGKLNMVAPSQELAFLYLSIS